MPASFLLPYHSYLFLTISLFAKNQHFPRIKKAYLGLTRNALNPPTGRADATANNPLAARHIGKSYVAEELMQEIQREFNKIRLTFYTFNIFV